MKHQCFFLSRMFILFAISLSVSGNVKVHRHGDGSEENFTYPSIDFEIVATPVDGGIRENVPKKYRQRYDAWKAELLSTEFGNEQWTKYAENKKFILNIEVKGDRGQGAGTDEFKWDKTGRLVGATITLGARMENGFPNAIYYPVLNALSLDSPSKDINGKIVAATKFSHELGHVDQASKANMEFLQLQNRLMPEYNSIFLSNGLNVSDEKLVRLAKEMQGTPIEIWESREYWSEVNAMLFLTERVSSERFYCDILKKIRRNVESYASSYRYRFLEREEFASAPCWN